MGQWTYMKALDVVSLPPNTSRVREYTTDLPRKVVDEVLRRAFELWSNVTALSFTKTTSVADIQITFAARDHGDEFPFDGHGHVLAHAFPPGPGLGGDAHFDEDETWVTGSNGTNLLIVAAHEIGHCLGLNHSEDKNALMYHKYNYADTHGYTLPSDDVKRIQSLYGPPVMTTQMLGQTPTQKRSPGDTEKQRPGDTPTSSPGPTVTQTPGLIQKRRPGQIQKQQSGQTQKRRPGQNPTSSPGQTQKQRPGPTQKQRPGQTQKQRQWQAPTQIPGQTQKQRPGQTQKQRPWQAPTQTPGPTQKQRPGQTPTPSPGLTQKQRPGQTPTQIPGQTQKQRPGPTQKQRPGQDPAQTPVPNVAQTPGPTQKRPGQNPTPSPGQMPTQTPGPTQKQGPGQTPPKESLMCDPDVFMDAAVKITRRVLFFKNGFYKTALSSRIIAVNTTWPSITSNIDAAVQYCRRGQRTNDVVFFAGHQYWHFTGIVLKPGFPKNISEFGFPDSVMQIDAAMQVKFNWIMFFVGDQYWSYNLDEKQMSSRSPSLITDTFTNISKVDAAFEHRGTYYLTSGPLIYQYLETELVEIFQLGGWMDCN
ncbi:matrix metalloproteinase-18-like isoform X2 [Rhincodon typus]|uniref:matrix metalloproteinase-18-like isoform X2 n=1 Tax=Rhincodon typus TaxID=259920 RepID=UPI00202E8183|nr:matrix metalloproteinase-18-like isoform X2 [Rhincodon typus]